jgi:hypothetical protein
MRKNIKYVSVEKPEVLGKEAVAKTEEVKKSKESTKDKLKELKKIFANSLPL